MTKKKILTEAVVVPLVEISSVSVTASGPWGAEEKEFIYPSTVVSGEVITSLSHELGMDFRPKDRKQMVEIVDHAKRYFSEFEASLSVDALRLKGEIKLKFKREPKKTIKIFEETDS